MNHHTWKLPLRLVSISAALFCLAVFMFPASTAQAACGPADVETNADYYYPLDDTAAENDDGQAVDHVASNPFNVVLAPSFAEVGTGSLDFNGTNASVLIGNGSDINAAFGDRTYEVWFAADTVTGRQQLFETGGAFVGAGLYLDDDTLYAGIWDSGGAFGPTAAGEIAFASIGGIQTDTAYHVFVVVDSDGVDTTVTLFLDSNAGDQSASATLVGDAQLRSGGNGNALGAVNSSTWHHDSALMGAGVTTPTNFDGSLDNFAVYINQVIDASAAFTACTPTAVSLSHIDTLTTNAPSLTIVLFVTLSVLTAAALCWEQTRP